MAADVRNGWKADISRAECYITRVTPEPTGTQKESYGIASKELGEDNVKSWIDTIEEAIRAVKADSASLKLQNEFYEKSHHPLDTRQ